MLTAMKRGLAMLRPRFSPGMRLAIASATMVVIVVAMFLFTSRAYALMSPLALKIATIAKWVIPAAVALIAVLLLIESRNADSARAVRRLTIMNLVLTAFFRLGLEPPPKFSVSELRELKEFNAEFDGVRITPHIEEIAKAVELSDEADPLRLGQSRLARGKLEDALKLFDKSLVEMKDMERVIGETHFYRGVALSRLGREDEAIVEADLAHAILPHMSLASALKCRSLRRSQHIPEALQACDLAIAEDPNNGWAWSEKGGALIELGTREMDRKASLFEEGIAASDLGIQLLPSNPRPWNNKAIALRRLGRFSEAIIAADRALALRPGFADALLNKGSALKHMGRVDEAAAIYREMTRQSPVDPEAWNNLGDIFETRQDYTHALQYYSAAAQQRSNYEDAWYNKGHMLNLLGRYAEALVALDRAVALNDADDAAFYEKSVALFHLERHADAIEAVERAIAINPELNEAKGLLARIKKERLGSEQTAVSQ